ncbi:Levodione reductase [Pseudocercospora fuligena]|uniref:Levodione reductase n=1 Tax=Pseudocercospora fuligena TaxID=685502 RepID=A0A8H6VH10_9PEZI|nr:Levodione reductase [Pseudocercospora fuligena]
MANLVRGTAFITGAGSGIGQYTAYALAKHGVKRLALCDIRPEALEDTNDRLKTNHQDVEVLNVEMDTSREDSVKSAINQTVKAFDRIDIAINNAGIGGTPKPSHENTLEDFQKVVSINLNGVWLCQRSQILQMLKQEPLSPAPRGSRGVIVNVASMLGLVASSPGTPACAYTATKHGVMGLTKTDAVTYAKDGIRINAICPGYIATPLLKSATAAGVMNEEVAKVPMGRLGEMEEIADAIAFLSSEMSSFMCGSGLVVDGGYTAQ